MPTTLTATRSARVLRIPRGWSTRTPAARRVLLLVSRFGFLTKRQIARLDGRPPERGVDPEITSLRKVGFLRALRPTYGPGSYAIYSLTHRAHTCLTAQAGVPPSARANLDRIDEVVAAADLALELQESGDGLWHTWAEHLHAHPPAGAPGEPGDSPGLCPTGILEPPRC